MLDKNTQALYDACSLLMFPGIVVVALYRSFLSPLLVHPRLPAVLRSMLTCPLCLGFHVSWLWLLLRTQLAPEFHATALDWITMPVTGAVIAYAFEHTLAVLVEIAPVLQLIRNRTTVFESDEITDADDTPVGHRTTQATPPGQVLSDEDEVEALRRGGCCP